MEKHSLIRTIYLYAFSLLGLILLVISGVRFLDMGLRAFVFTQADEQERINYLKPPIYLSVERLKELKEGEIKLSEEEKTQISRLLRDYQTWEEQRALVDPITARRHREASLNLAMILIGFPLYLYHWNIIKKETRKS